MQHDSGIGKVASNTPAIMCNLFLILAKSVELFLVFLVKCLIRQTKETDFKTIGPNQLIEILDKEENLDFLKGSIKDIKNRI